MMVLSAFRFMLCLSQTLHGKIVNHANISTSFGTSKSSFQATKLIIPHEQVPVRFAPRVQLLYERIASNERNSLTLAVHRDGLLPKLLSGELRVKPMENGL